MHFWFNYTNNRVPLFNEASNIDRWNEISDLSSTQGFTIQKHKDDTVFSSLFWCCFGELDEIIEHERPQSVVPVREGLNFDTGAINHTGGVIINGRRVVPEEMFGVGLGEYNGPIVSGPVSPPGDGDGTGAGPTAPPGSIAPPGPTAPPVLGPSPSPNAGDVDISKQMDGKVEQNDINHQDNPMSAPTTAPPIISHTTSGNDTQQMRRAFGMMTFWDSKSMRPLAQR
jgi:hypothetical protein